MNEVESDSIDYTEKELTNEIKRKSILYFKFILIMTLIMLTITLFWSLMK